jgi:hypothetical protein
MHGQPLTRHVDDVVALGATCLVLALNASNPSRPVLWMHHFVAYRELHGTTPPALSRVIRMLQLVDAWQPAAL